MTRRPWVVAASLLPLAAAAMQPIHMVVKDADDQRPIAGAHVLFAATAHEGSWSGHGGARATMFLAETTSDASGRIDFPEQKAPRDPFLFNTNYESPFLLVFHPGYSVGVVHNESLDPRNPQLLTRWDHDGETVTIRRARSDKERGDAIRQAGQYASDALPASKACWWKTVPRILVAIEQASAEWAQRHPAELREGPISNLMRNEAVHLEAGCGSPAAFFLPYGVDLRPQPAAPERIVIGAPPPTMSKPAPAAPRDAGR